MKRRWLRALSILMLCNGANPEPVVPDVEKEALELVATISENIADLIIDHKKNHDPQITKQRTIELIKSVSQAISLCIKQSKSNAARKAVPLHDQQLVDAIIEHIAKHMIEQIQAAEMENI